MDFWPEISSIDLREEMHAVLFGRMDIEAQGRPVLLRRLSDTKCVCFKTSTGSPNPDCAYCKGEGYLFTETAETMYIARGVAPIYKPGYLATSQFPQAQYGYTDPNRGTGYCEYSVFPDYERYTANQNKAPDKLYELKIDSEGRLSHPLVRTLKWKILNVVPLFGDRGRIEFFELTFDKETV